MVDSQIDLNKKPRVAIAIVTWNSAEEIANCLRGLSDLPENWEVWVVDNQSADETTSIVARDFPFVRLVSNKDNKGFAEACNQVVNGTDSDYVLFLNPDTQASADALIRSLEIAENDERIGILGVRIENPDGSLQTTCFHFPTPWKNAIDSIGLHRFYSRSQLSDIFASDYFGHDAERDVDWIKGAFMLARKAVMDRAGAIPEDYFMFAEDMDFCWQVKQQGFDVRFSPEVSIVHASNKSAGQLPSGWRVERTTLSKYLFCLKNFGWFPTRLIQLSDLIGCIYRMLRLKLTGGKNFEIAEARMYRHQIIRSLFLNRRRISEILQTR